MAGGKEYIWTATGRSNNILGFRNKNIFPEIVLYHNVYLPNFLHDEIYDGCARGARGSGIWNHSPLIQHAPAVFPRKIATFVSFEFCFFALGSKIPPARLIRHDSPCGCGLLAYLGTISTSPGCFCFILWGGQNHGKACTRSSLRFLDEGYQSCRL